MKRTSIGMVGLAAIAALVGLSHSQAASPKQTAPTVLSHYRVTTGWGNDDYAANVYTPGRINIYVGDTVTWHANSLLEPHTITFGPISLLKGIAQQGGLQVIPQRSGPPQLAVKPAMVLPTLRARYDGTGFANSGVLTKGRNWSLTFTRPGVYRYHCLIHFPRMTGEVVVNARPAPSHLYTVRAGYGSATSPADAFFPDTLSVHVGDSVTWVGGFHSIAFGPAGTLRQLRQHFIVPVPSSSGPPRITINARVAFPTGGQVYAGNGFLNSGLLIMRPHNTFRVTFTKPGVYRYACLVHPGMDGTIQVLP